ncbi:MAG: RNase adapter RapZ, partial [Rhodobacterales bacterium]
MNKPILFVTGLSGAGRSEVMKALEDLNFFCIDNLPLKLLHNLSVLPNHSLGTQQRLALSLDVRGGEFFNKFLPTIDKLENTTKPHTILFL